MISAVVSRSWQRTLPVVQISGVASGSPADNAGLVAGDTITSIDTTPIAAAADLSSALANHQPGDSVRVAWLTDHTRPFIIVLVEADGREDTPLGPFGHLGVACASRADVDRLCAAAQAEGRLRKPPTDSGPPVGYWALLRDPDGHTLEVAHGQELALVIECAG